MMLMYKRIIYVYIWATVSVEILADSQLVASQGRRITDLYIHIYMHTAVTAKYFLFMTIAIINIVIVFI